jgi:hypothetical protein
MKSDMSVRADVAPEMGSNMFGKHLISEHAITLIRGVKFQQLKAGCNSMFAKHGQVRFQPDNGSRQASTLSA